MTKKNVVVIGGGTGTVAVLDGLKKYDDLNISVVVNMTDDGGSTAVVRDQFGLLPLSDLRKSVIGLSGIGNGILRDVFTYRFAKGEGLKGHTLGNLVMMGLVEITGSEEGAVEAVSKLFNVKGQIIPVTLDDVRLVAKYDDGTLIKGEHFIDEPADEHARRRIVKLKTNKKVKANPKAVDVIKNADFIIAGPGDLYTTTIANVVIEGIADAMQKSKGRFIFINNLMTKMGQTHGMKASDLVDEITKYTGRVPDYVLLNHKGIPDDILNKYKEKGEEIIVDDIVENDKYKVIRASLISEYEVEQDKGDDLVRSLIRHDSVKLSKILYHKIISPKKLSWFS